MWQKLSTVPALGAVFFLLTAVLVVSKPYFGELTQAQEIPHLYEAQTDPDIEALLNTKHVSSGKMLAALEYPKPKREDEPKPVLKKAIVASQTIYKPTPIPFAPADIEAMVRKYASEYGANPEVMLIIAKCESGFRAEAISPSGAYHGMYQFVASTWQSNRRAMGLPDNPELMHNAEEAIRTAAFKMGGDGYSAWPACHSYALRQLSLAN